MNFYKKLIKTNQDKPDYQCFRDCNINFQQTLDQKICLSISGEESKVRQVTCKLDEIKSQINLVLTVTKRFSRESSNYFDEYLSKYFDDSTNITYLYQQSDYSEFRQFTISLYCHPKLEYDIKLINDFQNMKEGETYEIIATHSQYNHVKMNLKHDAKMIGYLPHGSIAVYGLLQTSIESLVAKIHTLLESSETSKTIPIYQSSKLQYEHLLFDNMKRNSLQTEFDVQIDYSQTNVIIRGNTKNVEHCIDQLKNRVQDISYKEFQVSQYIEKDFSFQDFLKSLKKQYDVSVVPNSPVYSVFGSKSINWEEIDRKFKELEPVIRIFPDQGQVDNLQLQDNFGLISIEYRPEKNYFIVGRNQKQVQDVITKLNELIMNRETKSIKIDFQSKVLLHFTKKSNIQQTFSAKFPGVQLSFRDMAVGLCGPKHLLTNARSELIKQINDLQKALVSKRTTHSLPPKVARDVLKLDFCVNFNEDNGVWISDDNEQCEFNPPNDDPNNNVQSYSPRVDNVNSNNHNTNYNKKPSVQTMLSNLRVHKTEFNVEKVDILTCGTETIVNAANDALYHAGGIAGAISKAAGPAFQKECTDYVNNNGNLNVGTSHESSSYGLQKFGIKSVIHTVAPMWYNHSPDQVKALLKSCVQSALTIATKKGYKSISIPVIGSGVYCIPKDVATDAIVSAATEYIHDVNSKYFSSIRGSTSLRQIKLIDIDDGCVYNLKVSLMKYSNIKSNNNNNNNNYNNYSDDVIFDYNDEETMNEVNFRNNLKINQPEIFKVGYQWKWRENDGSYKNFDPDQNYQIEIGYLQKQKKMTVVGDLNGVSNGGQYEIDFEKMTELNLKYKTNPRPIRREKMEIEIVGTWYFINSTGQRVEIIDKEGQIQMACNRSMSIRVDNYKISFPDSTVEVFANNASVGKFPLKSSYEQSFESYVASNTTNSSSPTNRPNQPNPTPAPTPSTPPGKTEDMVNVVLWSPSHNPNVSRDKMINSIKEQLYHHHTINLSVKGLLEQHKDKVLKAIKSNFCELKNQGLNSIDIYGPNVYTSSVENQILLIQSLNSGVQMVYPWDTTSKVDRLKDIPLTSEEGKLVNGYFTKTLSAPAKIEKIEKVQNNESWSRYFDNALSISRRLDPSQTIHGNTLNKYEMYLFHGTRKLKPSEIYNDAHAFDMRFSAQGMWGKSTYFAVNASYSGGNYPYDLGNGKFQMFLARVMIGDSVYQAPNTSIQRPPPKPKNPNDDTVICYDSINGDTNGSKVYMIYDINRAYPSYLITFTK
ncbi:U box domain-containing protein [Heterostelium album PN500]|uniref:Poly [ADP-ribose] polymerase n=1 Tax=Heterostelium pallidum (strain ATCC 26659 / Pp 5 / PN500) TaxID=670386 RepID=D3AWZ4_HETP5|nr:U box domain-containing protein [Heterostelium album PN500]EFA86817.1 U box domain-containing protein [Heterostelium album PN500]|eukprot:XP_020438920.1 U box domain-containing protein [Heterostelium album PN500]